MSKICDIDTKNLDKILNNLNDDNRKNAIFNSLIKGGQNLVEETKQELLKVLPNANRGLRYGNPMVGGVKLKKDKDYNEVKVHIMGDFRLKFFELGTDERYLRKPLPSKESSKYKYKSGSTNTGGTPFRGRIQPKYFFKHARENSDTLNIISDNLIKEIDKLLQ